MFSPDIVCSEEFLEMPPSSRELYFQLGMRADDDGFVQPKAIIRAIDAKEDDLRVLISKRFVLPFDAGVVVVKHWLIHNMIRLDRYRPTRFEKEKNTLFIKENKAYTTNPSKGRKLLATTGCQVVAKRLPQVRLGKDRIGKRDTNTATDKPLHDVLGAEVIKAFEEINPAVKRMYGNKTQRGACDDLLREYGLERVLKVVAFVKKVRGQEYYPTITTPVQLFQKWAALEQAARRRKNKDSEWKSRVTPEI